MADVSKLQCPICGETAVTCTSRLEVESPVSTLMEYVVYFTHECSNQGCTFREERERCIASLSESTDYLTEWGYAHKKTPRESDCEVECPMCGRRHRSSG